MAASEVEIGIIGAGIVGLACALTLSNAGYKVRVLARDVPGDSNVSWASPWAGAVILPSATNDERDIRMQKAGFRTYGALAKVDANIGVQIVKATEYWDNAVQSETPWYASFLRNYRALRADELAPGTSDGNTFEALAVDPDLFLPWLFQLLKTQHGVKFVRKEVASLSEAQHLLCCHKLVNASGHGSSVLAGDDRTILVRGQTMLVRLGHNATTQSIAKEIRIRRGKEYTYVIPRLAAPHTAIVGGIEQPGDFTTAVDGNLRQDILRRANEMTNGALGPVDLERDVIRDVVGFRPARSSGYRIERVGDVVHAYGFAGMGYRYSFGAAEEVLGLVATADNARPRL